MGTKHTPGPWKAVDMRGDEYEIRTTGTPERAIALVMQAKIEIPERIPNAKLIAAAPDLLAACKAAFEAIDALRHEFGTKYPAISEAYVNLGAAIRKAEGGA